AFSTGKQIEQHGQSQIYGSEDQYPLHHLQDSPKNIDLLIGRHQFVSSYLEAFKKLASRGEQFTLYPSDYPSDTDDDERNDQDDEGGKGYARGQPFEACFLSIVLDVFFDLLQVVVAELFSGQVSPHRFVLVSASDHLIVPEHNPVILVLIQD